MELTNGGFDIFEGAVPQVEMTGDATVPAPSAARARLGAGG
jgi:hypothetical protein